MDVFLTGNGTNVTKVTCFFQTTSLSDVLYWLQIGNVVASFVVMTLASSITVVCIVKSRQRLKSLANVRVRKSQVRDVKFAITSISLNLFFLITNAPLPFYSLIDTNLITNINSDLDYFLSNFVVFLWYLYYVFSFYVQLMANSLVRAEFFKMLGRNVVGGGGQSETNNNKGKSRVVTMTPLD